MALTLPYPDMVFVPLDILTAEEQNQLVGNIEFLANQFPIMSTNIANDAVQSTNIDWSSFVVGNTTIPESDPFSVTQSWTPTNVGSSASVSVVNGGVYIILATTSYCSISNTEQSAEFRLKVSSGSTTATTTQYVPPVQLHGRTWTSLITANSNSLSIQKVYNGPSGSHRWASTGVIVFRVG